MGACEYHNVIIITLISGKDCFMAVKAHFLATGLTTRVLKQTKCLPHNSLSLRSRILSASSTAMLRHMPSFLGISLDTRETIFSCYRLVPPKKLVSGMSYTNNTFTKHPSHSAQSHRTAHTFIIYTLNLTLLWLLTQ